MGSVDLASDAGPPGRPAKGVGDRANLTGLGTLGGEGLDGPNADERLEEPGAEVALAVGHPPGDAVDQVLEDARHQQVDRSQRQDGDREQRVRTEHHGEREGDLSRGLEDLADDHVQGAGHASGIDGEAADELPGPVLVEVAERQGQQVRMECDEHVVPDQQLRMCQQDLRAQTQQGDGPGDQQEEPCDVESDLDGIGRVEVEEGAPRSVRRCSA